MEATASNSDPKTLDTEDLATPRTLTATYHFGSVCLEGRRTEEKPMSATIPYIDPKVQYVGISRLRSLNSSQLRDIDKTLVIQENDQPLAVLLKYEEFLIMQKQLLSVLDTISVLTEESEIGGILSGLEEMHAGKTRSISEIRAALKAKKEKI